VAGESPPPLLLWHTLTHVTRCAQCAEHTHLHFTKRYWPLFGLRELVPIILDYQRAEFRRQLWEWAR
jgi:ditrans,polycis-polyprenyl diphosphate synthase